MQDLLRIIGRFRSNFNRYSNFRSVIWSFFLIGRTYPMVVDWELSTTPIGQSVARTSPDEQKLWKAGSRLFVWLL